MIFSARSPGTARELRALAEFPRNLLLGQRQRGAAPGGVHPRGEGSPVLQRDVEEGGEQRVALRRGFLVAEHRIVDLADRLLYVGAVHHRVAVLCEARAAQHQDRGEAEFHAELALQPRHRPMVGEVQRHQPVALHGQALDLVRPDVVLQHEVPQLVHGRLLQVAAGIRLDRHAPRRRSSTGCRACRAARRRCSRPPRS